MEHACTLYTADASLSSSPSPPSPFRNKTNYMYCIVTSSTPDTLAPGCLAHPQDPTAQALLNSMFTKRLKVSQANEKDLALALSPSSVPYNSSS